MGLRGVEYRTVRRALSGNRLDRSTDRAASRPRMKKPPCCHAKQETSVNMHLPEDALLLRIFIGESDRYRHRPLYEAIVLKGRELHLAGVVRRR